MFLFLLAVAVAAVFAPDPVAVAVAAIPLLPVCSENDAPFLHGPPGFCIAIGCETPAIAPGAYYCDYCAPDFLRDIEHRFVLDRMRAYGYLVEQQSVCEIAFELAEESLERGRGELPDCPCCYGFGSTDTVEIPASVLHLLHPPGSPTRKKVCADCEAREFFRDYNHEYEQCGIIGGCDNCRDNWPHSSAYFNFGGKNPAQHPDAVAELQRRVKLGRRCADCGDERERPESSDVAVAWRCSCGIERTA